jgi:predicted O-methyltransferase YrrM
MAMALIRRAAAALTGRTRRLAIVAKLGPAAIEAAKLLNGDQALPPGIRSAVEEIRERMLRDTAPREVGVNRTYGSVAEQFVLASSKDEKLAMLTTLIRWRHAESILEVGTFYGVSAVAMALAQERPNIVTIEGFEPQATIGAENIANATTGVRCLKAEKEAALRQLAVEGSRFDFVFHDGGHLGDEYVRDFDLIYPMLERGAVYVVDDINHDEGERREASKSRSIRTCLEGWNELVRDDRAQGVLVFRRRVGILLLA